MNLTAGLPAPSLRHHAGVLAQGPDEAAHIRDPPVEAGGLLHHVRLRVQGGFSLLTLARVSEVTGGIFWTVMRIRMNYDTDPGSENFPFGSKEKILISIFLSQSSNFQKKI